jgi:DNA modification methylase
MMSRNKPKFKCRWIRGFQHQSKSSVMIRAESYTEHKSQLPMCEWLIKTYSNEGETVLDFTMGSGSTGLACQNTGREFIGIEMDEEIFKIAEEDCRSLNKYIMCYLIICCFMEIV